MRILNVLVLVLITSSLFAQTPITQADMPQPGDTIRTSRAVIPSNLSYLQSGPNQNWDFTSLSPVAQRVDTFVSVSSTGAVFSLAFNNPILYPNNRAHVVLKDNGLDTFPIIQMDDVLTFYRILNSSYELTGHGANINGIPIPLRYDDNDIIYKFPLSSTSAKDSSESSYSMAVPALGYVGMEKKRVNEVDGSGTLTTPFGTFNDVIRIKSSITQKDTVNIDSLSFGLPAITRNIVEYKWMKSGYPLPLLQITTTFGIPTEIRYLDSARHISFINIEDVQTVDFKMYPNPVQNQLQLQIPLSQEVTHLEIYSANGQLIEKQLLQNQSQIQINTSQYKVGTYFIRLFDGQNYSIKKFTKIQ